MNKEIFNGISFILTKSMVLGLSIQKTFKFQADSEVLKWLNERSQ